MSEELVLSIGPTPGDQVYLNLGRAIAGQCPSGFEEARLDAEMGEAPAMRLACTPEGGPETLARRRSFGPGPHPGAARGDPRQDGPGE